MLDPTSLIDRLYLIIINHKVLLGRVAAHEPLRGREWFFQAPPSLPESPEIAPPPRSPQITPPRIT